MLRFRGTALICVLFFCALASRAVGQTVSFVDAAGQPASSYLEATRAYLRVVDPGANQNGAFAEAVTVELSTEVWSDQESVTLQETGPNTGVFEGSIGLKSAGAVVPNNGVLDTGVGNGPPIHYDTLTASYTDSGGTPRSATASTLGYRVWFLDAAGVVVASYIQGARVYVRLEDHNNNNPAFINTLYVELSSSSGDQEYLQVSETGLATGIYEGSIPLAGGAAAPNDNRLQAQGGDQITADRLGAWFPAPALAAIDSASLGFVDGAGQPAVDVLENGTVHVRVTHPQANADPGAVETVSVQLQSRDAGDQETVTLTETGPNTGLFDGSISLRYRFPVTFEDGILSTGAGRQFQPEEITATYGTHSAATHTIGSRVTFLGLRDQPMTSYSLRSLVRIRVEDLIDNNPGLVDELNVTMTSPETGDLEAFPLIETGVDTGLFYGSIPSLETAGSSFDGVLWVGAGQTARLHFYSWVGESQADVPFTANFVPVVQNESRVTDQDIPVSLSVLASAYDPEGDPISLAAVSTAARGSVTFDPYGYVTYTPNPGTFGQDTFTYVVVDEQGGEALGTVTVIVNGTPVANDDTASVDEDASVVIPVLDNDSDPENYQLGLTITTPPAHGTADWNPDGTVTYTPAADFNGTDTFVYRAGDQYAATASATVTVTVNPVNDAPVANADTSGVLEDDVVTVRVLDNDTDLEGDPLSVLSVTQPAQGAVQINPDQTLRYAPPLNFSGAVSFTYTVSDGNGGTATGSVTVDVVAVNDPPVANADTATVAEDGTVNVVVLANDTDVENNVLTVTAVTQGAHGTVAINLNKTLKYTPVANYNGSDSFTYTISDGQGGTATATVTVTITAVNDAPVANADAATVAEDGSVNVTVLTNDTDADGDTLTVTSTTQGAHGTVAINANSTVSYTPAANYNGADSFTYTVSDGNGGTATATVTITVTSVNDAPVANADAATVAEDGTVNVTILGNDSDPDGDTLTVASVTQGAHGAVAINPDKTVKYTPAANYSGADSFTYTASDGNGGTATATVTITVTAVNDAPVANADAVAVAEDVNVNVTVLTNDTDADGDTLTVTSTTQGAHGTVAINANGTVSYTPAANYNGADAFTYTVSDGNGGTATAAVTITVSSVNDAPVANADAATVAEDGTVNVTVLTNDADADGDTLAVASVTQGAHGTVAINANGTVSYTPAANYNGADAFTYTASDGNGGTATATVTITVTAVNDAPVANADAATVAEDGLVDVTVLANDSDPDGNVLSVASVTQGAHGSVVINPDKTVRYTPAANYNGADAFTYTISDGNGGTATAAVTINVTPVNDAPVAVNDSATVAAGGVATVSVLANDADVDGPSLAVTSVTQGAHGAVAISGSQVTYTAALYVGADSFTYTISDGAGGTATATVTVNVTAPRVATGIQARYDFNEGSGSTVNDTSGVGTPLNLTIASPASVSWTSGGLTVNTATSIASPGFATKIISAAQASNALTVEAWIQPASLTLTGPARILTLAKNSSQRNLVFGQSGSRYETQLKTSTGTPALQSPASSLSLGLTHVVYTRTSSGQAVYYINGVQVATSTMTGTFATWGADHKLILSDNWQGSYLLVAVYGRALTSAEVQQNYLAGANAN